VAPRELDVLLEVEPRDRDQPGAAHQAERQERHDAVDVEERQHGEHRRAGHDQL
jgi:hypothetical protein